MKRQWALTTLSQEDLTQPNFIVSTRTESRRGMSQSQSRSNQDLVRTRMGPRSEDNLPVPSANIPEDSSKSVPNLHANEKGRTSPKQNVATSPTNKALMQEIEGCKKVNLLASVQVVQLRCNMINYHGGGTCLSELFIFFQRSNH